MNTTRDVEINNAILRMNQPSDGMGSLICHECNKDLDADNFHTGDVLKCECGARNKITHTRSDGSVPK